MRIYKYKNKRIGEYYTFKVNNIFEAIYASKNPIETMKLETDLSSNAKAAQAMDRYKNKFYKMEMQDALRSLSVVILEDSRTRESIDFSKRYVRYNAAEDCWSPVVFNMAGGASASLALANPIIKRVSLAQSQNSLRPAAKPLAPLAKQMRAVPKPRDPLLSKRTRPATRPVRAADNVRRKNLVRNTAAKREEAALRIESQRLMGRIARIARRLGFRIRTLDDFYTQMTLTDFNKMKQLNPSLREETVIRNLRQRALQMYKTVEITNSLSILERQLPCDSLVEKLAQLRALVGVRRGGVYSEEGEEEYSEQRYEGEDEYSEQRYEGESDGSLWRALFSIPTMREEDDDSYSQDSDYEDERLEDIQEPALHELTEYEVVEDVVVRYDEYGNELYRSIMDMPVRTYSKMDQGSIFKFGVFARWIWAWKMSLLVAILSACVSFHIAGKLSTQYTIMYGTINLNSIFQTVNTESSGAILNPYDALASITEGFNKTVQLEGDALLQIEPFSRSPGEYKNIWHDYNAYSKEVLAPPKCSVPRNVKVFKDVSHVALSNEFSLLNSYIEYMHTCITTKTGMSSPLRPIQERFKKKYAHLFVQGDRYPTVANIVKENLVQYVVEEFVHLVKSDHLEFKSHMERLLRELTPQTEVYDRMVRFRDRIEQVRSMPTKGLSTSVCKPDNTQRALSVRTTLHAYTWQLMTDIFNSFHDIGKEQLVIHNRYIPVIKKLLDLKMDLREISASKDYSRVPNKLREILDEMTNLPQIEPFTTMMMIFESAVPNLITKNANDGSLSDEDLREMVLPDVETIKGVVNNAVSIIQGRNEHMRKTVEEYIKAYENAEFIESTFSLFGGVHEFKELAIGKLSPVMEPARSSANIAMKVGSHKLSISMHEFKTVAFELQTNIMDTLRRVQFRDTDQLHLNMLTPILGSSFAMKSLNVFMESSMGKTVMTMARTLEEVDPSFRSITNGMASAWKIGSTLLDTMNKQTRFANVRLFHSAIKYNYERAGIANIRNVDKKDGFYALQKSWQVLERLSGSRSFDDVMGILGVRALEEWTANYKQQTMLEMEMLSSMIMNLLLTMEAPPESTFGTEEGAQLRMYRLDEIVMDGEHLFDTEKTSVQKLVTALVKRMIYTVMIETLKK